MRNWKSRTFTRLVLIICWTDRRSIGLVCFFFFFHHSISVTHHLLLITLNTTSVWHNYSIFFHTICGPHICRCSFFFFFFQVPKLTKPSEKKKTRIDRIIERNEKKEKKKELNSQPGEERKKKVKSGQKLRLGTVWYCLWVHYMCLITILLLSYELWKQLNQTPP